MATDGYVNNPGRFLTHRDLSGSAATDNSTINDTNYPPTDAFASVGSVSIWIVWTGTGGTAADTIKIVPLVRDGVNGVWYLTTELTLTKDTLTKVELFEANQIYLRISNVSSTTATALKIRVALAEKAHTE